jgi:hypothetical protein
VNIKDFTMRQATRSVRLAAIAGLGLAVLGASACGSSEARQGMSPSYLIIDRLQFHAGAGDTTFNSDVQTKGSVFEDLATVIMRVGMRDVTNPNSPTTNNEITVDRYHVNFRRSDGRNTPGVDVPYPFDGAVTFTVQPGGAIVQPFVAVRVQSKLEPPLMNLRGLGGSVAISTIAEITFYGHDQAGRDTQVTGSLSINFADWADPAN